MVRLTCRIHPALISLGVLDDATLRKRIDERKLPLTLDMERSKQIVPVNIGHVSDLYMAKGTVYVSANFKASIAFYFKSVHDIVLSPVVIGADEDWRLLRFDVKKRTYGTSRYTDNTV